VRELKREGFDTELSRNLITIFENLSITPSIHTANIGQVMNH
jgi:hypothetical protein